MTDQIKTLQDDIAFLKDLVSEGTTPNRVGGAVMIAAGLIYGGACIAHWSVQTGRVAESPWAYPVIWLGATALFLVALSAIKARHGGPRTLGARASGMAWAGVGWTIFAMAGSMAIVSWRAHSAVPTLLFPSIILGLYGLGWMVAAAVTRRSWIWLTSIASYIMALVAAWFALSNAVMLIFAGGLALLAVAPGVVLLSQSRQTR